MELFMELYPPDPFEVCYHPDGRVADSLERPPGCYNYHDLVKLADSERPHERHLGLSSLTSLLLRAHGLGHSQKFKEPIITTSLDVSQIVSLACRLLKKPNVPEADVADAIQLMLAIVAPDCGLGDRLPGDWPVGVCPINLVSRAALSAAERKGTMSYPDWMDMMDREDIITSFVKNRGLMKRLSEVMSWLKRPSPTVDGLVIGLLTRFAAHSKETATILLTAPLLPGLLARRLRPKEVLCGPLLSMMAALARHSQHQCLMLGNLGQDLPKVLKKILKAGQVLIASEPSFSKELRRTLEEALDLMATMVSMDVSMAAMVDLAPLAISLLPVLPGSSSFLCALLADAPSLENTLLSRLSEVPPAYVRLHTAIYLRQRISSPRVAADIFYKFIVAPFMDNLPNLIGRAACHSILALNSSEENLQQVRRDRPALLSFCPSVGIITKSNNIVYRQPTIMKLDPCFSALSAVSHAMHALATSGQKDVLIEEKVSALLSCTDLITLLKPIANSPVTRHLNLVEPHSAIAQLQVEAISALILAVVACSNIYPQMIIGANIYTTLHKSAVALLNVLGPVPDPQRALLTDVVLSQRLLVLRNIPVDDLDNLTTSCRESIQTGPRKEDAALDDFMVFPQLLKTALNIQ